MFAVLPVDRHAASAVRHFPPGCGRPRNVAARKPPRPLPTSCKPPFPNSSARAATRPTTTAALPPRRAVPAATSSGTVGTDRVAGNAREASTAVTVRRYPPGCGRGVPVAKPPVLVVEGEGDVGASKPLAELCMETKARACDKEAVLCECAGHDGEFSSDRILMENEGGGGDDAGAQEEDSGKPWVVTGLMAAPFLPWAQHGRRSQRLNA